MRQSNASQSSHDSAAAERFGDITYKVIGAAMKVHNQLGPGLREAHYHQALSGALTEASLSFEDEKPIQVMLDDQQLGLLFILPPKKFEDWRLRARRYACIPSPDSDTPPLIHSSSADDSGVAR